MNHSWTIQRGKLRRPRLGDGLVRRQRLQASLDRALRVPLTLVAAPAGFGKTTLVADWAASQATATAWLTVDERDRDLSQFVVHVVAAIESMGAAIGEPILALLQRSQPMPAAEIGASLADELLDLEDDVVLVIDDYHLAASSDVEGFLSGLLPLLPPTFHLVLATRADPTLPLARLRLQHLIHELRAADLRFSEEETRALLASAGMPNADPAIVATLLEQTEGWVALLRLASLVMPSITDQERLAEAVRRNQHLMNFLAEEVLANQSRETQGFLLRTSFTERMCAPLADVLLEHPPTAGSLAMLDRLVHSGLFLEPVSEEPGWFRYHPLFRQLLRHQVAVRFPPDVIRALHTRAAGWYAQQDLIDEAIAHLIAAGDLLACAELVEQCLHRALSKEDWSTIARWIRLLPEEVMHERPTLLLARGWVAHLSGRAAPLRMILSEIETLMETTSLEPATAEALRAEAGVLGMATLLPIEQNPEDARRIAEYALAHLSPGRRFPIGLAHGECGLALQALGQEQQAVRYLVAIAEREAEHIDAGSIRALLGLIFIHRQAANLAECEKVARHTLTLAERHGLAVTAGWAHVFLGWLAYERDDLDRAKTHYAAVVADDRRVHLSCLREAMFGMALVLQVQGQPVAADSTVQRLMEIIIDAAALEHLPVVYGFEARLALLRRDLAPAFQWLATADISIDSNTLHVFEHALLTKAKVLLAQGSADSLEDAAQALAALQGRATTAHHLSRLVEIWAMTALMCEAQARPEAALDALQRSLALAERGAFYRTFVDLGPAFGSLLRRAHAQLESTPLLERLLDDAAKTPVTVPAASARALPVLKLLTLRECDVLDGLGRRRSYQEIADELFISPQTVKRHVGSIYSKLGVANRREALVMAESLGWSPSA